MEKIKKYVAMFLLAIIMSISVVSAQTYVNCQKKAATSKGYYDANCSGNYLKCHGYYESNSEKYTVMNYIGTGGNELKYKDGCHSGKRNAYISENMNKPYNQVGHTHSYTVNLD